MKTFFAKKLPKPFVKAVKRSPLWLRHSSAYTNVYHCCVHKTASQWLQGLLGDRSVYRFSGLELCPNGSVNRGGYYPILESSPPFPEKTIAGSLHISFPNFEAIQKREPYKAFFVMRDPRDLVISYYFSMKVSHSNPQDPKKNEIFEARRAKLSEIDLGQGLHYVIDELNTYGLFQALASWISAPHQNPSVKLFRFEDLTGPDAFSYFQDLFQYCDINLPEQGNRTSFCIICA